MHRIKLFTIAAALSVCIPAGISADTLLVGVKGFGAIWDSFVEAPVDVIECNAGLRPRNAGSRRPKAPVHRVLQTLESYIHGVLL